MRFPGGWTFPGDKLPRTRTAPPPPAVSTLVRIGDSEIDLACVRSLQPETSRYTLTLEDARTICVGHGPAADFVRRIGLDALPHLEPMSDRHRAMFRLGLRDFPYILLTAATRELKALLAAMNPILCSMNDPHYELYGDILSDMVGRDRLLTLHNLGFEDQVPHLRTVGSTHPDWIVVAEKASLLNETRLLGTTFGISTIVLGGMARWEATGPMARQLRPLLGKRRARVVSYCDYDPEGWAIADAFVQQLARYDVAADIQGTLVLPHRFSAHELDLVAEPMVATGANLTKLEQWMARTHGVNGRPLRIHADHLRPAERVIEAFKAETKLHEVRS